MSAAADAVASFPETCRWRVLVALPSSRQFAVMRGWLDRGGGPDGWSAAPAGFGGGISDAVAFYFVDPALARAFVARFACGYRAVPRRAL